ncbi:MAG TPA: hypothetical protein VL221_08120 [Bacteroidota bacterium]|nr:hypothetical protein [Bacteroidota bacterium]
MRTLWLCTLSIVIGATCGARATPAAPDSTTTRSAHDLTALHAPNDSAKASASHKSETVRAANDSARLPLQRAAVRRAQARVKKEPPVDVRALAALQSQPEPASLAQAGPGSARAALPLVAVSLAIAGGSTALILWLLARSSRNRRRTARAPAAAAQAPAVSRVSADEEEPSGGPEVAPLAPQASALMEEEEDDPFRGIGKEMRGAREEFALAMRMQASPLGDGLRRSAREACGENATVAERVKIARRLGVGRGEIDLALRLQKLETIVPAEEAAT